MACRYAGIDWATQSHDVLVADEDGSEVLAGTYAHDEKGLTALCRAFVRLEVLLVAIERPDGVLVERLLDAGLRVLALHPNKVAAARDRFRVSGGKSDRFDAFVLCELARTDNHRFRILEADSDQTKALRALTRAREDLVGTRTGVVNQLRAELERFRPGPLRLFSHMDAEIMLAFLEQYPSPADARGLGVVRMQAFLQREGYSGGQHPTALGRAWCRIVWRCWQDRVPYDPARHGGLQRHITVTIPTPSGPVPDLAATQRMPAPLSPNGRPAAAEREALDSRPTSATAARG